MTAVKQAVGREGYTFYSGFQYRIGRETQLFPAAWMTPVQLVKFEGREEGYATYKVTLQLLCLNKQYDEETKVKLWSRMEEQAIRVYHAIFPAEGVFAAQNLKTEPAEFTLTSHGELSLKVEFEAKMYYPNHAAVKIQ